MPSAQPTLSIREVADRSGVSAPTLRVWEHRYGFPVPQRAAGGHRRYSEHECELIAQVVRERSAGLALPAAIERVRLAGDRLEGSIYATIRRRHRELEPSVFTQRTMLALSRAVEDESAMAADHPLLIGAFQTRSAYRRSERRWVDLARTAELTFVLADFADFRRPEHGPRECPLADDAPVRREWAVVSHGPSLRACLAGWERPAPDQPGQRERLFEAVWTVEPDIVADAAIIAAQFAARSDARLYEQTMTALNRPADPAVDPITAVISLANRMLAYAA